MPYEPEPGDTAEDVIEALLKEVNEVPISSEVMRAAEIDTRLDRIEEAIDCLIRGEWQDADRVMASARAIRKARREEST